MTIAGGLVAATAIFLAGAVGAGGNPSSAAGVSARPVTARASGPTVVHVSSLPQVAARSVAARPRERFFRSPLGKAGLKLAKQNAPANAPSVDGPILAAPVPATPSGPVTGFEGMADSASICEPIGCQPSDQGVASNGDLVVQTVNTAVNIYDTSGSVQTGFPKSLQAFFGVPDATCDTDTGPLPFMTDPRVLYDPADHRFIVAALQLEGTGGIAPACPETSLYWVAVSQTNDPTGAWNVYSIDTHMDVGLGPGDADYTQLGFNGQGIFISGNLFDQAATTYLGAFVLGMSKAAMEAGAALSPNPPSGFGGFIANKQLLDTVQPVASYGAGDGGPAGEFLISSFNIAKKTSGVVVFDFSNVLGAANAGTCDLGHQCISGVVVKTMKYSQPPMADNGTFCNDCVETIDTRISATPVYMHGNVYFTHDTAARVGDLVNANVHWGIVHPVLDQTLAGCAKCSKITTKSSLLDQGLITYPGETDTWFGAIQPDREGNLFIGFDYQSETNLSGGVPVTPSSVFISRRATAAMGSGFPDGGSVLKLSTDPTDNFRWGDYSAIGFDGWESDGVWFATQYSGLNNDWATHIDQLGYTSPSQQ